MEYPVYNQNHFAIAGGGKEGPANRRQSRININKKLKFKK